jgi:hypothetical protein
MIYDASIVFRNLNNDFVWCDFENLSEEELEKIKTDKMEKGFYVFNLTLFKASKYKIT